MTGVLATESGAIITTESGRAISVEAATSNSDIEFFDFSVNLLKALLWQYNKAGNLQSILESKQSWYNTNQEQFWTDWYNNVFNLRTANEFGLKVWSIILQLPLFVSTPPLVDGAAWGFGPDDFNFENGNFVPTNGATVNLPLPTKRLALQLRYFQLCSSGTVPEINRFLAYIFADYGKAYLVDNHNMTQLYNFLFPVTSDLSYLFSNFDILPRPAGVGNAVRDATQNCFGFGDNDLNFNNGNFGA